MQAIKRIFGRLRSKTASQNRRTAPFIGRLVRLGMWKLWIITACFVLVFLPAATVLAAPPTDLTATADGNNVLLTWTKDLAAETTVIVRGEQTYPSDVDDGIVVYNGEGESCTDEGIYSDLKNIYYRAWSYTELDGYSDTFAQASIEVIQPEAEPMEIQFPALTELIMVLGLTAFALWRKEIWVYIPALFALVFIGMRWAESDLLLGIPFFTLALFMAVRLGWVTIQKARG